MALSIAIEDLHKQFGEFIALRGVSESMADGDRIALLGHNGAGKSTLLNILATLTRPTQGQVSYSVDGEPLETKVRIRARLGYLSHESMLYPDLTAIENLQFWGRINGADTSQNHLIQCLDRVGMAAHSDRLFRECSRGMQQRISIARALLAKPDLLLLDEPFSGLDADGRARLGAILTNDVASWLMVTHDWSLGYDLADRFWILHRGRLVHAGAKTTMTREALLAYAEPDRKARL